MKAFPRIVFMGTPEFAAAQLQTLIDMRYPIAAVVTSPDKPAGRGLQLQASAVKLCALRHGLPLLQPVNLREPSFLAALNAYRADMFVVVAFRMLPEAVWSMPPMGTFNLHASLLPQYRGAAPIQWAIINGEKQTGVTTFLLDNTMDTGKILLQQPIAIAPTDNAGTLHDKLMSLSGNVIARTINGLAEGSLVPQPQPSVAQLKTAPKLFKNNTLIDPNIDADSAACFVRGLCPYPAAWIMASINGSPPNMLKIYEAQAETDCENAAPVGSALLENGALKLRCRNGFLRILSLQPSGKQRMNTSDFLRGVRSFSFCGNN